MDEIHQQKLGVKYLARALFIEFHVFTRERPPLNSDGIPDLSSRLVRGGPVWRDFISSLGADYVNIAAPDVYMALERNMIQGVGWPIIGLEDASWQQHLKYRIDPGVFSSDVGIIFNKEKWDELPAIVRNTLHDAALKYETDSYQRFQDLTRTLDKRMRELGMNVLTLEGEGIRKYSQLANEVNDLKDEKRAMQAQLDTQRDTLEEVRTENAVLKQQIASEKGVRNLRNFGIAIGTGLVSTGLMMGRTKIDAYSIGLIVSGGLLLVLSWFVPAKRGDG